MAYCTNCGAATGLGERYCGVCGHQLLVTSSLPAAPPLGEGEFGTSPTSRARVVIGIGHEAPRQARWSVLLRIIMSIPLIIWNFLIVIAGIVVLVISWFAALILGRVPTPMQRFLTNVLRYSVKVAAYTDLLVAKWPGMWLAARPGDQISLEIDHVRLNRFAVFFRVILAVPSAFVSSAMSLGAYFLTFIMWVCALILGRVPQILHEARGQVWRFTTRSSAYLQLLTPTQPFANFLGDPAVLVASTDPASADPAGDAVPRLSTTWSMSTGARVFFLLCLITGAYFQVQPGITRWPTSYVIDRTVGPTVVWAINQNITTDMDVFLGLGPPCSNSNPVACQEVSAATEQIDIQRQLKLLTNLAPIVVRGRNEFGAYEHEVLIIDLTVEQIANTSSVAQQQRDLATLKAIDMPKLATLYLALHKAI
jgi:hypothetical protein